MEKIISKIYQLIKGTSDVIEFEERVQQYMHEVFSTLIGDVYTQLNQAIKEQKQEIGWTVRRDDWKTIQFTFGAVRFRHTLMRDEQGIVTILLMSGWDSGNISDIVRWWK